MFILWFERRRVLVIVAVPVVASALTSLYQIILPAKSAATFSLSDPRWLLWQTSLNIIRDNPVFGSGPGYFLTAYQTYQLTGALAAANHAHNMALYIAAESGLPSLVFFAVGMIAAVAAIVHGSGMRTPRQRLTMGLLMAIISYLTFSMIDVPYYNSKLAALLFLLVGLGLQSARNLSEPGGDSR
jgi:O-antigen ligase